MIFNWGAANPAAAFASGIIPMDFGAGGEGEDPGPPASNPLPSPVFSVLRLGLTGGVYMHCDDRPDRQNRR